MYARWGTFAVGLWLIVAPLVLGYGAVGPILRHVAMGLVVCIGALVALERPPARFGLIAPALWLLVSSRSSADRTVAAVEVVSGALLAVLTLVPSARHLPVAGDGGRAGARA